MSQETQPPTREEVASTVVSIVTGLLMIFGLLRCTPVWDSVTARLRTDQEQTTDTRVALSEAAPRPQDSPPATVEDEPTPSATAPRTKPEKQDSPPPREDKPDRDLEIAEAVATRKPEKSPTRPETAVDLALPPAGPDRKTAKSPTVTEPRPADRDEAADRVPPVSRTSPTEKPPVPPRQEQKAPVAVAAADPVEPAEADAVPGKAQPSTETTGTRQPETSAPATRPREERDRKPPGAPEQQPQDKPTPKPKPPFKPAAPPLDTKLADRKIIIPPPPDTDMDRAEEQPAVKMTVEPVVDADQPVGKPDLEQTPSDDTPARTGTPEPDDRTVAAAPPTVAEEPKRTPVEPEKPAEAPAEEVEPAETPAIARARDTAETAPAPEETDSPADTGTPGPLILREAGQLGPRAGALFRSLLEIHTTPTTALDGQSLDALNEAVEIAHNARMRRRVGFGHGATWISRSTAEEIDMITRSMANNVESFLIVGYADTTGTAEQNKAISEKRALSVADAMTEGREGTLSLQAAYLGSTDKFDSENLSRNRIVEIWSLEREPAEADIQPERTARDEPTPPPSAQPPSGEETAAAPDSAAPETAAESTGTPVPPQVETAPDDDTAELVIKAKPFFLTSAEELEPRAAELFRSLQEIHAIPMNAFGGPNLDALNKAVEIAHNARMRRRVGFGHGAAWVSAATAEEISTITDILEDKVESFLIVGYADPTGTAEQNRTISEKRALSVADAMTADREGTISLQAAYLGSTDKFDSENLARNRIVEIWSLEPEPEPEGEEAAVTGPEPEPEPEPERETETTRAPETGTETTREAAAPTTAPTIRDLLPIRDKDPDKRVNRRLFRKR